MELNLLTGKRNNEMLLGVYVCCMNQIFSELVERMRRCRLVEVSRIGNSCINRGTVAKHSDTHVHSNCILDRCEIPTKYLLKFPVMLH